MVHRPVAHCARERAALPGVSESPRRQGRQEEKRKETEEILPLSIFLGGLGVLAVLKPSLIGGATGRSRGRWRRGVCGGGWRGCRRRAARTTPSCPRSFPRSCSATVRRSCLPAWTTRHAYRVPS